MKKWIVGCVGLLLVGTGVFFLVPWESNGIIPEGMVKIPSGINAGTDPDFGAYSLTNATAFYMDKYEVTKAQWDTVYNWAVTNGYSFDNAGLGKASDHPVHTVNWYDCVKWCNARSQMEGKTPCYNLSTWDCDFNANGYRLPTTTEWEYAARGGLHGKRFPWGDTIQHSRANYYSSSSDSYDTSSTRGGHPSYDVGDHPHTSPVGSFSSNRYGLYDMSGNVWEWCNTASGSSRYFRGGSWNYRAHYARCGYGLWGGPDSAGTTASGSGPSAVKDHSAVARVFDLCSSRKQKRSVGRGTASRG